MSDIEKRLNAIELKLDALNESKRKEAEREIKALLANLLLASIIENTTVNPTFPTPENTTIHHASLPHVFAITIRSAT